MKFQAIFNDRGVNLLEKRFLPALEKVGKTCHLYLDRKHVIFLHNVLHGDGVQAITQFGKDTIFAEYRISSQNAGRIAFTIDLGLFLRALRSSVSMDGDVCQVKLVKKRARSSGVTEKALPFLTFESKGHKSAVVQDVPISQPLTRGAVQELQDVLESGQGLPQTLVLLPALGQLQGHVDQLKNVGDVLDLAVTKCGDFYLRVNTPFVSIGTEYRGLKVLGDKVTPQSSVNEPVNPSGRLREAINRGEAHSVKVAVKHFAKSLQCHLTKPDHSFIGVSPNESCVLLMFQYFHSGSWEVDENLHMHYRIPVLDSG
ncbi:hypothetical protein CBR_g8656 [Chara braunii]|uniref:Checkpoint protein n=1 Tax=Chara braunii TaxID=69332 RepID=A0A388JS59_CHABU|nr:hypothetical protein CBR_g8656 [Chara braunii]|eukprot:GBG60636.1 hypothetical protein CBR_g8656 [Chara braunii]